MKNELATFGMGCFWHPDQYFSKLKGVISTRVGYLGEGDTNYERVCGGDGHTEVVEVTFDPKVISYSELLEHFWHEHEFSVKGKGQYKSVIYYHSEEQKSVAEKSVKEGAVTEILPVGNFVVAEEYHQKYLDKRS